MLVDRDTMEPLTDKLHIILCSLREVPGKWEACTTELERILYLIKHMEDMDSTSLAYREGNYADIFEAARSSRLRDDEKIAYSQSLEKLRDTRRGISFAADKAREQGRAEGFEEGRDKERLNSIHIMLSLGIAPEAIAEKYGISKDEVIRMSAHHTAE